MKLSKMQEQVLNNEQARDFLPRPEWSEIQEAKQQEEHYDLLQLTKKIQL
jgi:hypothetical protein